MTVITRPALSGGGLVAHISPIVLAQSKQMRLARLYKGAVYREADDELRLPVRSGTEMAEDLVAALRELVPSPEGAPSAGSVPAGSSA